MAATVSPACSPDFSNTVPAIATPPLGADPSVGLTDSATASLSGCGSTLRPGTTEPDVDGAAAVVEALKRRGMLLGRAGQFFNVIKIRPPLVFDHEHAGRFLDAFADALTAGDLDGGSDGDG